MCRLPLMVQRAWSPLSEPRWCKLHVCWGVGGCEPWVCESAAGSAPPPHQRPRPGLAVSAPAAAAAQYGGGPVVLEPATSLNATNMEHGSARPGFVGVHIGAGQHSEVSKMFWLVLTLLLVRACLVD